MAQSKKSAAFKQPLSEDALRTVADDISAEDYSNNMFRDGHNRVAQLKQAKAYDAAAHADEVNKEEAYGETENVENLLDSKLDAIDGSETLIAGKLDIARSRDGTDASGSLDESGGFLGGTTEEVDSLEASATPVDKIPHMND